MMKPKKPNKTGPRTHSELAAALGITRQALTAAAQRPDAPAINDVAAWRLFLAAHGRTGTLPADLRRQIGEARLEILRQQRIALERENSRAAGETMLTADAERQAAEAMALTFSELERRDRELPPALAGLPAIEVFKRMHADTESIRRTLREKFQSIGK